MRRAYFFLFVLFLTSFSVSASTAPVGLVADFDAGESVNALGHEVAVWLKGDGSDSTQTCAISFVQDDAMGNAKGQSLKIDYDVDSPNPAYNGVRTVLTGLDASGYDTLSFYIKGDSAAGFSPRLKIELIGARGRPSPYIVDGITSDWQKITVPLDNFFMIKDWSKIEKFVVVFADITNDPKQGTFYLDHIYFSKEA